jgi:hypothetical protein
MLNRLINTIEEAPSFDFSYAIVESRLKIR